MSHQLRCINCGLNVFRMQRHLVESDDVRLLLRQWTSLSEIPNDSVVCHYCWLLIEQTSNPTTSRDVPTQSIVHRNLCIGCGHSLNRVRSHALSNSSEREDAIRRVIEQQIAPVQLRSTDRICHPCWQRSYRSVQRNLNTPSSSSINEPSTSSDISTPLHVESESSQSIVEEHTPSLPSVSPGPPSTLPVPQVPMNVIELQEFGRAPDTQAHCFFPNCRRLERLSVPISIRRRLFSEYNYYVPENCRICSHHLRSNDWAELMLSENVIHTFTAQHIYDFTDLLKHQTSIDFEDVQNMDDYLVHYWFGMSKEDFRNILLETPRLANMHRGSTALAAFLMKLRNGDSGDRISSLFQVPRSTLEGLMARARELLHQDFVPRHLGIGHITRDEIAQRNLLIPNGLFGGTEREGERRPIIIVDGTYIYCNKSANYSYQKKTYSLHKYRNLVKPFLFVCCDGYIIEILGPYPAVTSDADIINNEFGNPESTLRQYFQEGDVFILDRGFRDAVPLLQNCNYSVHMPSTLQDDENQLSTLEANKTRAVTICRWVVEVINGIFKQRFKIFRHEFNNRASPHVMIDFSIAAALINRFRPPLTDRFDAAQILEIIHQKMFQTNTLSEFIIQNNYNRRRAQFLNINVDNSNVSEFPQLEFHDLILIACGTYQLRQARSYYGEHIRFNGRYKIEVCREASINNLREQLSLSQSSWLLRAKIQSRHISRKAYFVYVLIDNSLNGREAISQYYCNCKVGKRTVGCCSHTMTILWYLGWARHQNNIEPPAQFLDDLLIDFDNVIDDDDNE
ncbi:hypothetical protein PYW08_000153 [Mythimna loreyi]|uniref:Uncharacterized protein n=1 Tax=Mythimna loreyi TaxID=667449 RepID=A0ACC2RAJ6_9NEOP|nr:hypothetical protein PYW08_000153 [Mythimna loreyi]